MKLQLSSEEIKSILLAFCNKELGYETETITLAEEGDSLIAEFEVTLENAQKETQV